MQKIQEMIEQLSFELKNAKKAMFANGRILDESVIMDLVEKLEDALPMAIREAQYVIKDKESMLESAKREADGIIADAEQHANEILDESNIIKQAKIEADIIMDKAEKYAAILDRETKMRIDKMFESSEEQIVDILKVIRSCREDLHGSMLKKKD